MATYIFGPNASGSYVSAPADAITISQTDDFSILYTLSLGTNSFVWNGISYSSIYANSSGMLLFGTPRESRSNSPATLCNFNSFFSTSDYYVYSNNSIKTKLFSDKLVLYYSVGFANVLYPGSVSPGDSIMNVNFTLCLSNHVKSGTIYVDFGYLKLSSAITPVGLGYSFQTGVSTNMVSNSPVSVLTNVYTNISPISTFTNFSYTYASSYTNKSFSLILKIPPAITFNDTSVVVGSTVTLNPSSPSLGAYSYSSSDTSVATVSGSTLTLLKEGTTLITVTQDANGDYSAGTKTAMYTVLPAVRFNPQTIFYGSTVTLNASSDTSNVFTYTSSNTSVATVSGTSLTALRTGTSVITATQVSTGKTATAIFTVVDTPIPDFYYRAGNSFSKLILNDAYLVTTNPVTSGLHRRFKASDFNPISKVWVDSALGNTVTTTGTMILTPHSGDSQYRTTNALQFDTSFFVNFENNQLNAYTLFTITRYSGTNKQRIISGITNNFLSGHWGYEYPPCTGVAHHDAWITDYNTRSDIHGNNFFIGTDIATQYFTNGVSRGVNLNPGITYLPTLCINGGNNPERSDGQILDILMYNRQLSLFERRKVEHYLASYYGILDTSGNLTASYFRIPLPTETSLLVSTRANPNYILYPSFSIAKTGLSFAFWFKASIPSGYASSDTDFTHLFDFGNGSGSQQTHGIAALFVNNNLRISVTTDTTSCVLNNVYSDCNDNVWRHLVWTISADGGTWNIYINKVLQASITSANYTNYENGGTTGPYHPSEIVIRSTNYIGKSTYTNNPALNGAIDDFKMFNYDLDQPSINTLYTVNPVTSMTVNIETDTLLVPIAGTSFTSSNPGVATISGTTIRPVQSGSTTITSNLHCSANPVQLLLTVKRNGIGFISGETDLIETIDKNTVQSLTLKPTITCQTMTLSAKSLYKKDLQLSLDGVSDVGDTTLTFGKPRPNLWVAIGSGTNTMAYSSDGITWMGMSSSIFAQGRGLAYNGRIWVAGGDGGGTNTLGYSYDGLTWTGLGNSIFNTGAYDFAWNGTLWVAAGGNSSTNTLAYSYDGINWIGRGNQINTWVNAVAWNGNMFVATGNGTVNMLYSYDGITWFPNHTTLFLMGCCVRWNGTLWIAGGADATSTSYILYSYNGIDWFAVTNTKSIISRLIGIAWNGILWVGVSQGTNTLLYSYNGLVWNGLGNTIFTNYGYSVTWNGQMFLACGIGTNTLAYSYDGLRWTGLGTSVFSTICYAAVNNVAYEHSITLKKRISIAGGRGANTLSYSYDGITWTGLGNSIFTDCYSIVWNGSIWVATGFGLGGNTFAYSYDGIKWVSNTTYNGLFGGGMCVAWNGSLWIAGGNAGTCTLASSPDGKVWTAINKTTFTTQCMGIATNGKRWVAVGLGANSIAYSDNGTVWTGLGTNLFTGTWGGQAVAWNGKMFLAGGQGTNNMAYSYDGSTWVPLGTSVPDCHGIGWNDKMWVVVGNTVGYSYDGKTWFSTPFPASCGYGMYVTWNGSLWIAATLGTSSTKTSTLAYSANGIQWYALGTSGMNDGVGIGSNWLNDPLSIQLYQPIVAGGDGPNTLAYSYDGITWTGLGKTIFDIWGFESCYNGSLWVAGGEGTVHTLAYSYDGINWTGLGKNIFTVNCGCVFYHKNRWYAGGSGTSFMAYSDDGLQWTTMGQGIFTIYCYTITSNGNIWLAGGRGTNTLAYSYDGINWTGNPNTPFAEICYSIAYNGTVWVAAGNEGTAYSYDGIQWTLATNPVTLARHVVWNGTVFGVVGSPSNVIAYSTDGIFWTTSTYTMFNGNQRGLLWTGDKWIIFAQNSPNMKYSFDGKTWINTSSTVFTNAFRGGVADSRLSDTLNITTDNYYQTGYKSITFETNQTN